MSDAMAGESEALELTLEREFAYPVEAVFKAWTESGALRQWMGPGEVQCPNAQMDAREGGAYEFPMISPDGKNTVVRGTVLEVVPNRKLRFTWAWDHEGGGTGQQMEVNLDFHATNTGTRVVLHHIKFMDRDARDKHQFGWNGCLENLEGYLAAS